MTAADMLMIGASAAVLLSYWFSHLTRRYRVPSVMLLLLTGLGVMGVSLVFEPDIAKLATLDVSLVLLTMLVAILATVLAAFYPTWRAAQVQPAWQLKSN